MLTELTRLKVVANNVRTFNNRVFEFYKGLNLIVGKNGSGKTTLVSLPYVAFYTRFPSSNIRVKNLVTRGERTAYIEILIEDNQNNNLLVKREYPSSSEITLNSIKLASIDEVYDSEVMKLIYVNLLDKIDFTTYINFDEYYEKLKKIKNHLEQRVNEINTKITSYKVLLENTEQKRQDKLNNEKILVSEYDSIVHILEEMKKDLPLDIESITKEYNNLYYIINNINSIRESMKKEKVQTIVTEIQTIKQKIESTKNEYNVEVNKIKERYVEIINQEKNKYLEDISSKKASISMNQEQYNKFLNLSNVKDSRCPVCNSKIDREHIKNELDKIQLTIREISEQITKLESEMNEKIQTKKNEYEKEVNVVKDRYTEILKKYDLKIKELQSRIDSISVSDDDVARKYNYSSYNKMYEKYLYCVEINNKIEQIKKYESKLQNVGNLLESVRKDLKELAREIVVTKTKINELMDELDTLLNKTSILDKLLDKKKIKQFILSRIVDKINSLSELLVDLPIKMYAYIEDEKVVLSYKNTNGFDVQFDELSSGERVMATIISLFVYRKLLESLNYQVPKIMIFDELLDRLDYENASNVLYFLSNLDDHIILIVTHREDIIHLSEEIEMNVVKL